MARRLLPVFTLLASLTPAPVAANRRTEGRARLARRAAVRHRESVGRGRRQDRQGALGRQRGRGPADGQHDQDHDRLDRPCGSPPLTRRCSTRSSRSPSGAAKTTGSSANCWPARRSPVKELLYGLLLPSGNDAAAALAEHFGPRFGKNADGDGLQRFVAEMNRRAKSLGLKEMAYKDPNGLSRGNVRAPATSPRWPGRR